MTADEREHRKAVRRAWALLSGFDPDELEARVERRAEEMKAEIEREIMQKGEMCSRCGEEAW